MWTGTRQQYFELYETAAKAIKAHDASLKVGGPAATNIKSELIKPFLAWCRERNVPLDFLSWHAYYGVPEYLVNDAVTARKVLDEYGFKNTENHLNEWRYLTTWSGLRPSNPKEYASVPEWFGRSCRAEGAAFCATVLLKLQDSPIDVLNFYTADTSAWSMFGQFGIPTKVFYVFKAFNELAVLTNRVACTGGQNVVACAGLSADQKTAVVLLANFKKGQNELAIALRNVPWGAEIHAETFVVDETRDMVRATDVTFNCVSNPLRQELSPNTVLLIQLSRP